MRKPAPRARLPDERRVLSVAGVAVDLRLDPKEARGRRQKTCHGHEATRLATAVVVDIVAVMVIGGALQSTVMRTDDIERIETRTRVRNGRRQRRERNLQADYHRENGGHEALQISSGGKPHGAGYRNTEGPRNIVFALHQRLSTRSG